MMRDIVPWVLIVIVTAGHPASLPKHYQWRTGKLGSRSVAVISIPKNRFDVERDRRSVFKDKELDDYVNSRNINGRDLEELQPQSFEGKYLQDSQSLELLDKEIIHKRRHGRNRRRRRRFKNLESKKGKKLKKKKSAETKMSSISSSDVERSEETFDSISKRKRKRRDKKKKDKTKGKSRRDRDRKGRKERKRRERKKGKRKSKEHRSAMLPIPEDFPAIINEEELTGKEACQYINLRQCAIAHISFHDNSSDPDSVVKNRCIQRKMLLKCMGTVREEQHCSNKRKTLGNLQELRNNIRDNIYTLSSCILTEALTG